MDAGSSTSVSKMDNKSPKRVIKKMVLLDKTKLENLGLADILQRAVAKSKAQHNSNLQKEINKSKDNSPKTKLSIATTSSAKPKTSPKLQSKNSNIEIISNTILPKNEKILPQVVNSSKLQSPPNIEQRNSKLDQIKHVLSEKIKMRQKLLKIPSTSSPVVHENISAKPVGDFKTTENIKKTIKTPVSQVKESPESIAKTIPIDPSSKKKMTEIEMWPERSSKNARKSVDNDKTKLLSKRKTPVVTLDSNIDVCKPAVNMCVTIPNEIIKIKDSTLVSDKVTSKQMTPLNKVVIESAPIILGNTALPSYINEIPLATEIQTNNAINLSPLPAKVNTILMGSSSNAKNNNLTKVSESTKSSNTKPSNKISQSPLTAIVNSIDTSSSAKQDSNIVPNEVQHTKKSDKKMINKIKESSRIISDIYSSISSSSVTITRVTSPVSKVNLVNTGNKHQNSISSDTVSELHKKSKQLKSSDPFGFAKVIESDKVPIKNNNSVKSSHPTRLVFSLMDSDNNFLGYDDKSIKISKQQVNVKMRKYSGLIGTMNNKTVDKISEKVNSDKRKSNNTRPKNSDDELKSLNASEKTSKLPSLEIEFDPSEDKLSKTNKDDVNRAKSKKDKEIDKLKTKSNVPSASVVEAVLHNTENSVEKEKETHKNHKSIESKNRQSTSFSSNSKSSSKTNEKVIGTFENQNSGQKQRADKSRVSSDEIVKENCTLQSKHVSKNKSTSANLVLNSVDSASDKSIISNPNKKQKISEIQLENKTEKSHKNSSTISRQSSITDIDDVKRKFSNKVINIPKSESNSKIVINEKSRSKQTITANNIMSSKVSETTVADVIKTVHNSNENSENRNTSMSKSSYKIPKLDKSLTRDVVPTDESPILSKRNLRGRKSTTYSSSSDEGPSSNCKKQKSGTTPPAATEPALLVPQEPENAPKRRGRKRKAEIVDVVEENDTKKLKTDEKTPAKSSAKSKKAAKETVANDKSVSKKAATQDDGKNIVCGNCKEQIQVKDWKNHIIFHNGLTWKDGIEEAFDLNDPKMILKKMLYYMKTFKQTTVTCPKCKTQKKSALGLISHLEICGLTEEEIENAKIECPHCHTRIKSVSISTHIANHCSVLKQIEFEKRQQDILQIKIEEKEEFNDSGRLKRTAVKKAEQLMKKIVSVEDRVEEFISAVQRQSLVGGVIMKWKKQFRDSGKGKCINGKCSFHADSIEDLRKHHYECDFRAKEGFLCLICKLHADTADVIEKHIRETHMSEIAEMNFAASDSEASSGAESSDSDGESGVEEVESEFEASDGSEEFRRSRSKKIDRRSTALDSTVKEFEQFRQMVSNYLDKMRIYKKGKMFSLNICTKKTIKFRMHNFSKEILYADLLQLEKSLNYLERDVLLDYMPKEKKSIKFKIQKSKKYPNQVSSVSTDTEDFLELKLFGSRKDNNKNITMYCGGPVTAMKWVSLPDDYEGPQYLAVSCYQNFNDSIKVIDATEQKCLIQIWEIESFEQNTEEKTKLLYAIAYDHGPVLSLDFCPSGGYCPENGRLALLAVTSFTGDINIFALPLSLEPGVIVKLQDSLCLKVDLNNTNNGYSTRVCWSEYNQHTYIAAGYSLGVVAVWNLNSTASLLKYKIDNQNVLLPIHLINNPSSSTTALAFHNRFLMVSTLDRKTKVYDLESQYVPKEISSCFEKSRVTCGEWSSLWPSYFLGFDQGYALSRTGITLLQPHNLGIKGQTIFKTSSSLCDISSSDWTGACVAVSENGDFYTFIPQQLLYSVMEKDSKKVRCVLGYTDVIYTNSEAESNESDSEVFRSDLGIVFCDIDENSRTLMALKVKDFRNTDFNRYPINKINRVAFNKNKLYCKNYALGYQAGFVRIKCLEF